MSIVSVLMFGSHARGDQSVGSDVDILMIDSADEVKHVRQGKVSLFIYPWSMVKRDTEAGSLFFWHIASEAKQIYDPENYLDQIRKGFTFKKSYELDRCIAIDLACFIVEFVDEIEPALFNKRALWATRTILIGKSAEQRTPTFSPVGLARLTKSDAGRRILQDRNSVRNKYSVRDLLCSFLQEEVGVDATAYEIPKADWIKRFRATSNSIGLRTATASAAKIEDEDGY